MSFISRTKKRFFFNDDDNPEEYEEDVENEEEEEEESEAEGEEEEEEEDEDEMSVPSSRATARRQTYASASKSDTINTRLVYNNEGEPKAHIDIFTPENHEDAYEIARALLQKHSVTINLELVNHETAMRILDFLSGVVFACRGEIIKIAKNTWMVTPEGVGVKKQGFLAETESNDAFYG